MLLCDGGLGLRCLFVLDEGVGNVILLLLEDERFDDSKLRELSPYILLDNLDERRGTVLLILEM